MAVSADWLAGDLKDKSFPRLLWGLAKDRATGILSIKKKDVEKKIFFEGGSPVHTESNLLHETLGKFLVGQGLISETQEQAALVKMIESPRPLGEVLVEIKAIEPAKLYEALRKILAMKILDCFAWEEGEYQFAERNDFLDKVTILKMNTARLIMKGVDEFPEVRLVASGFGAGGKAYRVASGAPADPEFLALTTEELKTLNGLKEAKTPATVANTLKLDPGVVLRRMFGFWNLGLLTEGEEGAAMSLDELVGATLLKALRPVDEAPSVSEKADPEALKLANEIASEHMRLIGLNYFELLNCEESARPVEIRDKFVEFSAKFNPGRFRSPALGEFRERGEEIFLRGVKAFSTLSDYELKMKYTDKLKAERSAASTDKKKAAGEAFKIQTKLLDSDEQFQLGLRCLKDKKFPQALEYFEYARDCDSKKPSYVAHVAWAKYQMAPERNRKEAEGLLRDALKLKPENEWPAYYLGKILLAALQKDEALPLLKRAAELAPKNIEIVRDARNAEKAK